MEIGGIEVHPDMEPLLNAKAAIPITDDPEALRAGWTAYAAVLWRGYPAGMNVTDTKINYPGAGTDGQVPVRIYVPSDATSPSPAIVYLHGGAFIKGNLDSGDTIAWGIADRTKCIVVSVDYRLAPENPFPCAPEDCYAVVDYLAREGLNHGIDPDRLAIWGDSAGGNLTAAVCLMARDRGGPRIAGQALNYATLTDELDAPAFKTFADAPITTRSVEEGWELYLGDRRPIQDPYAVPLKAKDLSKMPPAIVGVAEIDCLADDGYDYARRLKEAGNDCELQIAKGMIHGYLRSRFHGPQAAAEFDRPCDFLRARLFATIR